MLRRVLPVAAAAAALVAIPSTASATAPQAPVENIFSAGYYGYTDFDLPGGRRVYATLSEYRGASQNGWSGALSVSLTTPCPDDPSCVASDAWGTVLLTQAQVDFSRNLDGASALDVPMTLTTSPWSSDDVATTEQATVSLVFRGTGAVARDSYTGNQCADGIRVCQSHVVSADRDALAEFVLDGQSTSGPGHLYYSLGTDTAAPKYGPGGY